MMKEPLDGGGRNGLLEKQPKKTLAQEATILRHLNTDVLSTIRSSKKRKLKVPPLNKCPLSSLFKGK
jgi:hypothetical protein